MRILILGGTRFIGPHVVEAAVRRGHDVTIFHRGSTMRAFDVPVREVFGDRTIDLSAVAGRWDAVIDTSGYEPESVARSTRELDTGRYIFVSTVSVYDDLSAPKPDEDAPLHRPDAADSDDPATRYGARKALCEELVMRAYPDSSACVRCGLVVGPGDHTDRFTYWAGRLKQGGDVLVPGPRDRTVQFIDVRDLAAWLVHLTETDATGGFNAVADALPVWHFVNEGASAFGSHVRAVWADDAFLLSHDVAPWTEMPLWLPDDLSTRGAFNLSNARARAAGLRSRDVKDTLRDTAQWAESERAGVAPEAGLAAEKEAALIAELANAEA